MMGGLGQSRRLSLGWIVAGLAALVAFASSALAEEWGQIVGTWPPPPAPAAVFLVRNGAPPIPLQIGTNAAPVGIVSGDLLLTREGGSALFVSADGKPQRIGPGAEVLFPRRSWIEVLSGACFFFTGRAPSPFHIQTAHVVGGSLNTEFEVRVEGEHTRVTLLEGRLGLTNAVESVVLEAAGDGSAARVVATRTGPLRPEVILTDIVQWWLAYPAVLVPEDAGFPERLPDDLRASVVAYEAGALQEAVVRRPPWPPATDPERTWAAALRLVMGETAECDRLLSALSSDNPGARGLRRLLAVMMRREAALDPGPSPGSASEWLAQSYVLQARHDLPGAFAAASEATRLRPQSGIAWVRRGELAVAQGDLRAARAALQEAARWSPRHAQAVALRASLDLAGNRPGKAAQGFEQALALDPLLADGWLGRGLLAFRAGHPDEGVSALVTATALQPNRSAARAYLGRALLARGDSTNAAKEFAWAAALDPADPTPWLYQGLARFQALRFNEAVTNFQGAIDRNENRRVSRSHLLLDSDQAMRRANLARAYREVGMDEWSIWEAAQAVNSDYSGYAAHLFLANSYGASLGSSHASLRFETAAASEYLVANLLSPVGGTRLSQLADRTAAWDEFQVEGGGWSTETLARTSPSFEQSVSRYGQAGRVAYSLDGHYAWAAPREPSSVVEDRSISLAFKEQVGPEDDLFLLGQVTDSRSHQDVRSAVTPPGAYVSSVGEREEPNLFLGHHRVWAPGMHSLLLIGWVTDDFRLSDPGTGVPMTETNGAGRVVYIYPTGRIYNGAFEESLRSRFRAFSGEGQLVIEREFGTLLAGVRGQLGSVDSDARLDRYPMTAPVIFAAPASSESVQSTLYRVSPYAYALLRPLPGLGVQAGMAYDRLSYPANTDLPPLGEVERETSRWSPKIGITWSPVPNTTVRAAYTRSLGGLFQESSLRLEPVQVAGFLQAFRSLIPEGLAGSVPGARFETADLGLNQRIGTGTYLGITVERLASDVDRSTGIFSDDEGGISATPAAPRQVMESLRYDETSVTVQAHQLVGERWAVGTGYRWERGRYRSDIAAFHGVPQAPAPADADSSLHLASVHLIFNDPRGFFARATGSVGWFDRAPPFVPAGHGSLPNLELVAGYRFARGRCEIAVAGRNLTDEAFLVEGAGGGAFLPWRRTGELRLTLNY